MDDQRIEPAVDEDADTVAMERVMEDINQANPSGISASYREGFEDGWFAALEYVRARDRDKGSSDG